MKNIAPSARDSLCLKLEELRRIASNWGVRASIASSAIAEGQLTIHIGKSNIPVHYIEKTADGLIKLGDLLTSIPTSDWLEHYIILQGFDKQEMARYRQEFIEIPAIRGCLGTIDQYPVWVARLAKQRLGPLARLAVESKVRCLAEQLIGKPIASEPVSKQPLVITVVPHETQESFFIGDLGIQLGKTLFAEALGAENIQDLQHVRAAQKAGYDIVMTILDELKITADVKTETPNSPNICLEKYSNYGLKVSDGNGKYKRTATGGYVVKAHEEHDRWVGWLHSSTMDILITIMWSTGDMFIIDFPQIKQWVEKNKKTLKLVFGTVEKQNYVSQVYLADMQTFLKAVPDSIHLNLRDWLPTLYAEEFKFESKIPYRHKKTLNPQTDNYLRAAALKNLEE